MKKNDDISGPGNSGIDRRRFIFAGCAACAAGAGLFSAPQTAQPKKSGPGRYPSGKMRLRVVYMLHAVRQPKPDWPNLGFDFAPVMERINSGLTNAFPDFEFLPAMASGIADAEKILLQDTFSHIDGYIVYQMNTANLGVAVFAASGKPVLFADFPFGGSGGFLAFNAIFLRGRTRNVGFVSSSNMDDFLAAVKCFEVVSRGGTTPDFVAATAKARHERTPAPGDFSCNPDPVKTVSPEECRRKMKESKILAVMPQIPRLLPSYMGIPLKVLSFTELNEAWKAADRDQARQVAERWQKSAAAVEGVSMETLESSAAMYLGMKEMLGKHNANAITINCLGGFYSGQIHAYPCMGFHELCNEGLIGACESDVRSTTTMILINALTNGRPGYISDPVLDTSQRRIIYAHCVASNRPFGPQGPANPFQILTHSEDRKGASVRSILPLNYLTTTLEVGPRRKKILFHQARTVANDPEDRACRTKLAAEPKGDIEKLFTMWDRWGWHRVTAYGDLKEPVFALAEAMGYKVVEEA